MTTGVPEGVSRAPEPVQRLARAVVERGYAWYPVEMTSPGWGDRLYGARTHIGEVRIWSHRLSWGVTLGAPGMPVFVDAGVWEACRTGEVLGMARPPIGEQVAWLEELLASRSLPPYEVECLTRLERERREQPPAYIGLPLAIILITSISLIVAMAWASLALDMVGLRVMAAGAFAALLGWLLRPVAAHRAARWARQRREEG